MLTSPFLCLVFFHNVLISSIVVDHHLITVQNFFRYFGSEWWSDLHVHIIDFKLDLCTCMCMRHLLLFEFNIDGMLKKEIKEGEGECALIIHLHCVTGSSINVKTRHLSVLRYPNWFPISFACRKMQLEIQSLKDDKEALKKQVNSHLVRYPYPLTI